MSKKKKIIIAVIIVIAIGGAAWFFLRKNHTNKSLADAYVKKRWMNSAGIDVTADVKGFDENYNPLHIGGPYWTGVWADANTIVWTNTEGAQSVWKA